MAVLAEDELALFRQANFAVVVTMRPDGGVHASLVWVDEEDRHPRFNTTVRRAKARHLERDPRVTIIVWDRHDPYHYLEVEGLAKLDTRQANEHIHQLSNKYLGHDFPDPRDRITARIWPIRRFHYTDGHPPPP